MPGWCAATQLGAPEAMSPELRTSLTDNCLFQVHLKPDLVHVKDAATFGGKWLLFLFSFRWSMRRAQILLTEWGGFVRILVVFATHTAGEHGQRRQVPNGTHYPGAVAYWSWP